MEEFNLDKVVIRHVKEDECGQVVDMITELAIFEKMEDQVKTTADGLRQDIFGQPARCYCLVAEYNSDKESRLLGYGLYYVAYAVWDRSYLHLEDLYVKPDFRQKGIGKKLYQAAAQIALDQGFPKVELEVLDWNKPAKDFYEKVGNTDMTQAEGWRKMRMPRDQMEKFVRE